MRQARPRQVGRTCNPCIRRGVDAHGDAAVPGEPWMPAKRDRHRLFGPDLRFEDEPFRFEPDSLADRAPERPAVTVEGDGELARILIGPLKRPGHRGDEPVY